MSYRVFKLCGYEALLVDNRIEVAVPDENEASRIIMALYKSILDGRFKSLRITLPATRSGIVGRHIFFTRKDKNHGKFTATEVELN